MTPRAGVRRVRAPVTWLLLLALGVLSGCAADTSRVERPGARADGSGVDRAGRTAQPAGSSGRPAPEARRTLRALHVLHRWDRARSSAYAAGDRARLRHLYTHGSRAGAADAGVLGSYVARGLVVRGMRRQVLEARVRRWAYGGLSLRVTDRLTGAVAVGAGVRQRLPVTAVRRWVLTFARTEGRWRVAGVAAR